MQTIVPPDIKFPSYILSSEYNRIRNEYKDNEESYSRELSIALEKYNKDVKNLIDILSKEKALNMEI